MSSRLENNRASINSEVDVSEETEECDCVKSLPYKDWILKQPDGTQCPVPSTEMVDGVNAALSCLFETTCAKPRHRKSVTEFTVKKVLVVEFTCAHFDGYSRVIVEFRVRLNRQTCYGLKRVMSHQKKYKYTLSSNNGILSSEQRDFFEINGFIIIKQLIDETLLDQFKQRFIDICEDRINRGGITVMKDISSIKKNQEIISNELIVNKIQDILWDDVFQQYFLHPKLLDYVQCITGNNIMAMHSMLINKPPDTGSMTSRHPMHQDLHYFAFRPADRIVATWTAMQTVTKDNGCLFVLPGSHIHPGKLLPHEYPEWKGGVNKGFHGIIGFDNHQKKYLDMNPGDTVLFHPLLIHGSGPNTSQETRKAISCHFASCECQYIDVTGTTQQNIAIEVKEIARRRGFNDMDFKDFWKFRSRLVRGLKLHL